MTPSPKKQPNRWLALINIPIQMGIIIFLFSLLGQWLDGKYPNSNNWYTKGITVLGVFVAMYNVLRQVKEIDKNES
ncbi:MULTISPECIES: AtpZ/AtpI family protein [Flavobacterium]|uniref:AtpZ/AtpI family protein n=1 Tax=Flavobacterium stagni TaxID=2506421 RepID=A0A4Q1KD54_9FLAO|nr:MULTISPECIES: AtpZ/AtpI family protein [Flavobacterium]RXR24374.1 AtpZ/AtpI family protein [Flavobacterium stagni]